MENKKFLQLGLINCTIPILNLIISLIASLATNSCYWELANLPFSPLEIIIITF